LGLAEDARILTYDARESDRGILKKIINEELWPKIQEAAKNAENSIKVPKLSERNYKFDQIVKQALEKEGFQVEFYSDQRDNDSYWTISW